MIRLFGKNKETCRKLEKEELYDPGEISQRIEEVGKEREPCGCQELM